MKPMNKRHKLLLCVLCVLCGAEGSFAAGVRTLTLDDALAIAMERNRDIEKAREYGKSVWGRYVEERSAALPQLGLNGSAVVSQDDSQRALQGQAQTGQATAGLSPRQYANSIDLTLSQPLFTWGKLSAAIRAADVGLKTAGEQLRLYRQAAWRDVATAFYDILLAREMNRLAAENLAQKQRHLDESQRKFAAGVATDYDILAAEVAVENARPDIIRTENAIRTARERLRFLLALGGEEELDVSGTLETPLEPSRPYEEALATARGKRPELADARYRIDIFRELITIAASENKPRLDLKAGTGLHWLSIRDTGVSADADGAAWNVGVFLSFPFFDGLKSSGRVVQAESDLATRRIEEAKLLDSIALEVRDTGNALKEAAEIVQALSGTVKQAERLLQMAEKGYELGVKIRLEVDDAQLNLLLARSNLARAQRDYRVARVNYDWAMGVAGE